MTWRYVMMCASCKELQNGYYAPAHLGYILDIDECYDPTPYKNLFPVSPDDVESLGLVNLGHILKTRFRWIPDASAILRQFYKFNLDWYDLFESVRKLPYFESFEEFDEKILAFCMLMREKKVWDDWKGWNNGKAANKLGEREWGEKAVKLFLKKHA